MKAVLVVDIPNGYGDVYDNKAVVTLRNGKLGTSLGIYNVLLKPLPEQRYMSLKDEHDDLVFQMGWNSCLDEILGEEK